MKMKLQYETEIYVSGAGYLVIKQDDHNEEGQTIFISPEQALLLSDYILDKKDGQKIAWESKEEE